MSQAQPVGEFETLMLKEQERMRAPMLTALVLEVSGNGVLVDAGLKSQCLIPKEEFEDEQLPAPGDMIECAVVSLDHQAQGTLLSREIARRLSGVRALTQAIKTGEIIEAKIIGLNKGGLLLATQGCKAFMPKSLARNFDLRSAQIGQILACRVDKCDSQGLKAILALASNEDGPRSKMEEFALLEEGAIVSAQVRTITAYGAFCSFGPLSGLLHISQIAHERIESVEGALAMGDTLELKVISIDRDKQRISLSRKALLPRPERAPRKPETA